MQNEIKLLMSVAKRLGGEIIHVGKPVKTVEQATRETNVSQDKVIKSLVLVCEREPVLVIVDGISRVSMKKVEKLLGKCRFAKPKEVKELTGYQVGGVPPIAVPLRTIVDEMVVKKDYVIGGGGRIDTLLKISPCKIVEYQKAEVMDIRE